MLTPSKINELIVLRVYLWYAYFLKGEARVSWDDKVYNQTPLKTYKTFQYRALEIFKNWWGLMHHKTKSKIDMNKERKIYVFYYVVVNNEYDNLSYH